MAKEMRDLTIRHHLAARDAPDERVDAFEKLAAVGGGATNRQRGVPAGGVGVGLIGAPGSTFVGWL
jgi:hypothetical protein